MTHGQGQVVELKGTTFWNVLLFSINGKLYSSWYLSEKEKRLLVFLLQKGMENPGIRHCTTPSPPLPSPPQLSASSSTLPSKFSPRAACASTIFDCCRWSLPCLLDFPVSLNKKGEIQFLKVLRFQGEWTKGFKTAWLKWNTTILPFTVRVL